MAASWLQVDQTYPVGYILSHILIRISYNELNQSDTYMMNAIRKRFEGVVPSHGGTQQWYIHLLFIFYASLFDILVLLQWHHPTLREMARIYSSNPILKCLDWIWTQHILLIMGSNWSLYHLLQFDYCGYGQHVPCTVMDADLFFFFNANRK